MKNVSFVVVLSLTCPVTLMAYSPTVTDADIRNHSYTLEEIDQELYNSAMAQNPGAPVFSTFEDNTNVYYKWTAPNLSLYQTTGGAAAFSLTDNGNDSVDFLVLDSDNNVITRHYYYTPLDATNNQTSSPSEIVQADFIYNDKPGGYGGALRNGTTVTSIIGNFIGNRAAYGGALYNEATIGSITGNFIGNDGTIGSAGIFNQGSIGSITGDFVDNYGNNSGAVHNFSGRTIDSVHGNFIKNVASGYGGAITNNGTIGSVVGDFIGNVSNNNTGGAIYNSGTINSIVGDFINNESRYSGGAIQNEGTIGALSGVFADNRSDKNITPGSNFALYNNTNGTISFQGTSRFVTPYDNIMNLGTISTIGGTADAPTELYLQSVSGIGSFNLNGYTNVIMGADSEFAQQSLTIGEHSMLQLNGGAFGVTDLTNNGTLGFNNGIIYRSIPGSGQTTIDGDVTFYADLVQDTIINPGGNLIIALDRIQNINLTNNGKLWLNGGTLTQAISNYGNVGVYSLIASADLIDTDIETSQLLRLTTGTLTQEIFGSGTTYIDYDNTVSTTPDKLHTTVYNSGNLNLGSGTLSRQINGSGNIQINYDKTLYTPAAYLGFNTVTNYGTVVLNSGVLQSTIAGTGTIVIPDDNVVSTGGYYLQNSVTNNGTLTLTGGSLMQQVSGLGNILIDGNVLSYVNITQPVTINNGKVLRISVDAIKDAVLTNDGKLVFTGGTLDRNLSSYGNVEVESLYSDAGLLDTNVEMNAGYITLTGGTLENMISGGGTISIQSSKTVTTNADNLAMYVSNNGILNLTGGTVSKTINGGSIVVGEGAAVSANAGYMDGTLANNGTITFTGGTMWGYISGSGNLIIDGDVTNAYGYNLVQDVTINPEKSLTIYANRQRSNALVNNGTLILNDGTLAKGVSGAGNVVIDGDVTLDVNMPQDVTINSAKTLITSFDRIQNITVNNSGTLRLTGGTLNRALSGYGDVVVMSLTANADYIDADNVTNSGTLYLTGGTLGGHISGGGTIQINSGISVAANADNLGTKVTNNGTLTLTGGTVANQINGGGTLVIGAGNDVSVLYAYNLGNSVINDGQLSFNDGKLYGSITGTGQTIINGDMSFYAPLAQDTIVGQNGALTISVDNVQGANLENNGMLWLSGGTLNTALTAYGFGNVGIKSLTSDASYIDQEVEDTGSLVLTGGTLEHLVHGTGIIRLNSANATVSTDADYLGTSVANNGHLTLTGGTLNNEISGTGHVYIDGDVESLANIAAGDITINSGNNLRISGDNISANTLAVAGTLTLTDGGFAKALSWDGSVVIDGDVVSSVNMGVRPVTINPDKSLTISVNNIANATLTNNGKLWFSEGTLSNVLSDYGTSDKVGVSGSLGTAVSNINQDLENNGVLSINSNGTLEHTIFGTGTIRLGDSRQLTSDADYIDNVFIVGTNAGLSLTGGTINKNINKVMSSSYGYVYIAGDVIANAPIQPNITINSTRSLTISADNIQGYVTNSGTLNLTSGTLSQTVSLGAANARIVIGENNTVSAFAGLLCTPITNNGTLTLTGGTLPKALSGSGVTFIDGDVTSDANLGQHVIINENKSLTASLNNIQVSNLTNNGRFIINGGTLSRPISQYGNVRINSLVTSAGYLDTDVSVSGTLTLTGGTLNHQISGGTTYINNGSTLTTNADNLGTFIRNFGTLTLTGGTLINTVYNTYNSEGNISITEGANVFADATRLQQPVYNNGTLNLLGGSLSRQISGTGEIVIVEDYTVSANANLLSNPITNNGVLSLTSGTLSQSVTGDGAISIDGAVTSNVNMAQPTTITGGHSLTVSVDNIKDTALTNNGTLWFNGGTLDKALTNYGSVGTANNSELYANFDYIDQAFINNGVLYLTTGGTLENYIGGAGRVVIAANTSVITNADNINNYITNNGTLTLTGGSLLRSLYGAGNVIIDGDVTSYTNIGQDTTINANSSLAVSVDNIKNTALTNNGTLWFNGGTLDKALTNYGNTGVMDLIANANLIDQDIINSQSLYLTGGTLTHSIAGDGTTYINGSVTAMADIDQAIVMNTSQTFTTAADHIKEIVSIGDNGYLCLTGGTLSRPVAGYGTVIIEGDVVSDVSMERPTRINPNASLTISVDNIKNTSLTNNGTLWFSSGTLNRFISYFGNNVGIAGEVSVDPVYLNRDTVNNGTLSLLTGTLSHSITGTGSILIDEDVTLTANADYIKNSVINNSTLALTGGTVFDDITGTGIVTIANGNSIYSNADYLQTSVINSGNLYLTAGTLNSTVSGTGTTTISNGNTVAANATCLAGAITNNGTLNLTGGTLAKYISGYGNVVIDGDVEYTVNTSANTTINQGKSLLISANNINSYNTLTNNGALILTGGTLTKNVTGTGNIIIDGAVTATTTISQNTTINDERSLTAYASYIGANTTENNGTLFLTGGTLANSVVGTGDIVINNGSTVHANAQYIGTSVTNNGSLVLTGGTLNSAVTGEGSITINGPVISNVNMAQDTTIAAGKALTVSVDNIKNTNLINSGKLWFSGGTLDKSVSSYGDVGIAGDMYANANYLNIPLTNNGTLVLTGGTLRNLVTGSGDIVIDGDVVSNVAIAQDTVINAGKSLTASVDNVINANLVNGGMLWFNDGMLNTNISGYGNTGNVGVLYTNANYLDTDFINNGILNIMGGTLSHAVSGNGNIIVSNNLITNADYIGNNITNNGSLILSGGTLANSITGAGNTFIDGDVVANENMTQSTIINGAGTLTIFADKLHTNSLVNNGTLLLTGGALSKNIGGNGQTVISGNITNIAQNSNTISIADAGYFTTDANLLLNPASLNNQGTLNVTSGTLGQNINGGQVIIGDGAIVASKSVSDIEMNGTWNIDSNTAHASNAIINGIVNMNIDKVYKDSDVYVGGKLIADNLVLGEMSELRLVVAPNDLNKGESTGELQLVESDAWTGNWRNVLQNNAQYTMHLDEDNHTIKFTYVKTGADIVQEQNVSPNIYVVFVAWNQENSSDNPIIQEIIDKLNYALQYDNAGYVNILSNIAPTDANVVSGTSRTVNSVLNNQVADRLASVGRNGGDAFSGVGVWGQGLYNHSSQSGDNAFTGNTFGFSLGADKKFADNFVLGLGYSLSKTSATAGARNIDATGHTLFAYGEYRPHTAKGNAVSPLYLNAMLSYGMTSYTDVAEYGISSDYDTATLGLNANVGYDITKNLDLFVGGRYLKISQNDYTDSVGQNISVPDEDVITVRLGGAYKGTGTVFAPTVHLELMYDVKSSDRLAVVNTAHSSYQIAGDAINPFGAQAGLGFITNIDNWNLSLNYDLEWHPGFISHTGRIKARYAF